MSKRLSPENIESRKAANAFRLEHQGKGAKQKQRLALAQWRELPPNHGPRGRGRIPKTERMSQIPPRLLASVARQRDFAKIVSTYHLPPLPPSPSPVPPWPVVVDHCVAIRAAFGLEPDEKIGELIATGEVTSVLVPAILDVLEKVLSRPRVAEGILDDKRRALTRAMYEGALDVSAFPVVTWEDVGDDLTPDDIFLLVAAAKAHLVLSQSVPVVTMDKRLLQTRGLREPVLTPEQFLSNFRRKP